MKGKKGTINCKEKEKKKPKKKNLVHFYILDSTLNFTDVWINCRHSNKLIVK